MATRLLPNLQPGVTVPDNLRNGIDPNDFTIGPSRDAILTFRSQESESQDTIGVYLIEDDDSIGATRPIFPDSSKVVANTTVRLSDLYSSAELESGRRFGLFLVADGAGDNPGGTEQPNPPSFTEGNRFGRAGSDPLEPASVNDQLPPVLYYSEGGDSSYLSVRGDTYHASAIGLNYDRQQHVLSGLEVGSRPTVNFIPDWEIPGRDDVRTFTRPAELRDGVLVGFEDLRNDFGTRSDFDFNDVVMQVNVGRGGLPALQNGVPLPDGAS